MKELEHSETERKKAQDESKKSKEFLSNIINALDDSFFIKDQEHRWLMLNDAACELMGRPREELIGKSDYDLFSKEQADVFWEKDNHVFETGKTNVNEEQVTWHGKVHTISTKKSLYTDPVTGQKFITGTNRDITERKKAEESLRRSERMFRTYFELGLVGMAVTSPEKGWTYVNDRLCEILGYTRDELIQTTWADLTHPDDLDADVSQFEQVLAGQIDSYLMDKRFIRKDGRIVYISLSVACVRREDGSVEHFIAHLHDITDRKKAEEALEKSEERLSTIVERSPIPTSAGGSGGSIVSFNKALEELTGYGRTEIKDVTDWSNKLYPDREYRDFVWKNIQQALRGEKQDCTEFTITHKDGSTRTVDFHTSFHKDGLIIQMVDITERKQAEEALREQREKAQKYLDVAGVMFLFLDTNGEVTLINSKGCEVLGYKEEEIIGKNWFDTFIPKDRKEDIRRIFRMLMAGEIEPGEYAENIVLTKNGDKKIIAWHNTILRNEMGNIIGTLSSGEDITERKKVQEAVFKEKKFTEDAINAQMDTFFVFEARTGKAIRWNKAFTDISGYTDGEIARMPAPASYYSPEDLERAVAFTQKVLKERVGTIELELICKDGCKVPTEYRVSIINDDQREPKVYHLHRT